VLSQKVRGTMPACGMSRGLHGNSAGGGGLPPTNLVSVQRPISSNPALRGFSKNTQNEADSSHPRTERASWEDRRHCALTAHAAGASEGTTRGLVTSELRLSCLPSNRHRSCPREGKARRSCTELEKDHVFIRVFRKTPSRIEGRAIRSGGPAHPRFFDARSRKRRGHCMAAGWEPTRGKGGEGAPCVPRSTPLRLLTRINLVAVSRIRCSGICELPGAIADGRIRVILAGTVRQGEGSANKGGLRPGRNGFALGVAGLSPPDHSRALG